MRAGLVGASVAMLFGLAGLADRAEARVTRVVVEEAKSPAFDGRSFGKAGQYEVLSGHFFGELDPGDPLNRIITDIKMAPRNARGKVEYSATFSLIKPIAKTKAERMASGDPRPSLEERYGTHDQYVAAVRAAAGKLVGERLLLQDDADRIVAQAADSAVLKP